jgi:alpha-tubulin suppressor-like RCC1 family protein
MKKIIFFCFLLFLTIKVKNWDKISVGYDNFFAINSKNEIFACGNDCISKMCGKLGLGNINSNFISNLTKINNFKNIKNVKSSIYFSIAVNYEGLNF